MAPPRVMVSASEVKRKRNDKYKAIKENWKHCDRKTLVLLIDEYGDWLNMYIEEYGSEILGRDLDE